MKRTRLILESPHFLTLLLVLAVAWSITNVDWGGPIMHANGGQSALKLLLAAFMPDLSPRFLLVCLQAAWQTLSIALASITVAVFLGLPLGVLASGTLATPASRLRMPIMVGARFILGAMRSIHELVWAVLLVAAIGLSPLAAIIALGIPYAGIPGRIYAEFLEDVPREPLVALRSSGASSGQTLLFGRLPMCLPDLVSYTFYRFECSIRSAAILSFVGIRGIGYEIQLSLSDLLFGQVWTLLFLLLAIVALVDFWSGRVRTNLLTT